MKASEKKKEVKKIVYQLRAITNRLEAWNDECPLTVSDGSGPILTALSNIERDLRVALTGRAY